MNSVFNLENFHVKTRFSFHTETIYYQKTVSYSSTILKDKLQIQGFRIINKNPEFLAPSHGCVIQNRATRFLWYRNY